MLRPIICYGISTCVLLIWWLQVFCQNVSALGQIWLGPSNLRRLIWTYSANLRWSNLHAESIEAPSVYKCCNRLKSTSIYDLALRKSQLCFNQKRRRRFLVCYILVTHVQMNHSVLCLRGLTMTRNKLSEASQLERETRFVFSAKKYWRNCLRISKDGPN